MVMRWIVSFLWCQHYGLYTIGFSMLHVTAHSISSASVHTLPATFYVYILTQSVILSMQKLPLIFNTVVGTVASVQQTHSKGNVEESKKCRM